MIFLLFFPFSSFISVHWAPQILHKLALLAKCSIKYHDKGKAPSTSLSHLPHHLTPYHHPTLPPKGTMVLRFPRDPHTTLLDWFHLFFLCLPLFTFTFGIYAIISSWKSPLWLCQITLSYILTAPTYHSGTFAFDCLIMWLLLVSPPGQQAPWGRNCICFCSLLYLQHLIQCSDDRKRSINTCWVRLLCIH